MNILFMNNAKGNKLYGIERWMLAMAADLRRCGHQPFMAARPDSGLLPAARGGGLPCLPIYARAPMQWLEAWRLRRFLIREKIEGICAKNYKHLRLAALARVGLPVALVCRRGNNGDIADNLRHRIAIRWCCDGVVVPSLALKGEFGRIPWLDPGHIFVMLHEIDVPVSGSVPPASGLPECACRVAFAGRLSPTKGTDILLRAWRNVRRQAPGARLLLIGASEGPDYRRLAAELGVADSVDFAGFQPDVKPWLAASDLLVLPSRREGGGYVLLEAMAMGRPCVGSRVGGIPEYIEDLVTGLVVPPGDEDRLAAALVCLANDPERRRQMGAAARQRAAAQFKPGRAANMLVAIFEQLRAERTRKLKKGLLPGGGCSSR